MEIILTILFAIVSGAFTAFYMVRKGTTTPIEAIISPTEAPKMPVEAPLPPNPTPMPPETKYKWDTVENARHSVRVICDEEQLTVIQKNNLCATVGAESGWQSYYLSGPKKGQPVKLDNMKGDVVWSTDFGIAQINTYFHIGHGKTFPSPEYVLDNPEKCIRWMCARWKEGHAEWWIAYKNGSYKQFLGLK